MLPVIWSEEAQANLAYIIAFIADENPAAARRMKERLEAAVLPLSEHPYLYPRGRVPNTRELVAHPNYLLVYRVAPDQIRILNVLHARQEYP